MNIAPTVKKIIEHKNFNTLGDERIYSVNELCKIFDSKYHTLYFWIRSVVSRFSGGEKRAGDAFIRGKDFKEYFLTLSKVKYGDNR